MTPKAPSPWPPRLWIKFGEASGMPIGVRKQDFEPTDDGFGWQRVITESQHTHLLAEAVREAWEAAANSIADLFPGPHTDQKIYNAIMQKASELRKEKGATLTPENGGKE